VEWLVGGPTGRLSAWATRVRKDIERAGQLDMFMAYFSPSQSILRRIARIGRKGRARLVLAAKSDNNATIGAARSLYAPLLKGGVEIWEFQPTKLHTKLIVVDDAVYLGSANFDVRSLFINLEIMLRIEDAALAHRMRAFISQHAQFSERITARAHQRQATFWNRLRWNLGWLLVSVIDYNVSRRLNLGL
jgi:cardiolipin synthase